MKMMIAGTQLGDYSLFPKTIRNTLSIEQFRHCPDAENTLKLIFKGIFLPDILICDYNLPDMNGLDLAMKIKARAAEQNQFIYIILLMDSGNKFLKINAFEYVDDIVSKPLDIRILFSRIEAAFRILKLIQEKNSLIGKNEVLNQQLTEVNRTNEKLITNSSAILEQISVCLSEMIENKDYSTGYHVLRVGYLSELIGKKMQLKQEQTEMLKYAGFFHDIGKIGIKDEILKKTGSLTEEEYRLVQKHPQIGAEIIKPIHFFRDIVDGVLYHHERWDGKGYPSGLSGENIPLVSRIIGVADTFDSIVHPRSYKNRTTMSEAFMEVKSQSARQFDPAVVEVFETLFSSGSVADIYEQLKLNNAGNRPAFQNMREMFHASAGIA